MKKKLESLQFDKFKNLQVDQTKSIKGSGYGGGPPTTKHEATWSTGNTQTVLDDHYVCDHSSDSTFW